MQNNNRIFILAPHTDDGELGCGGSIAKHIEEGKEVFYIAFSTCSEALPKDLPPDTLATECKKATAALNIPDKNVILYDFNVRMLLFHRQEILQNLLQLSKQYNPDLIYLPAAKDVHQDHQVIYAEGLRAFKNSNILGYELPWNNWQFQPNYFETISEEHLKLKYTALQQYQSQSGRKYMSEDFTRSLAVVRGIQANTQYAEAFEVYRMIR